MSKVSDSSPASTGAGTRGAAMKSRHVHIQLTSHGPFSDGVLVGNTLYLSGRIGLDESGKRVPEDIEMEARNVMDSVEAVLRKAGMQMDDLVYVQVFCSDLDLWRRFNEVYSAYFKGEFLPARAFIGADKLLFGAHFEVQGIAVKQGSAVPAQRRRAVSAVAT